MLEADEWQLLLLRRKRMGWSAQPFDGLRQNSLWQCSYRSLLWRSRKNRGTKSPSLNDCLNAILYWAVSGRWHRKFLWRHTDELSGVYLFAIGWWVSRHFGAKFMWCRLQKTGRNITNCVQSGRKRKERMVGANGNPKATDGIPKATNENLKANNGIRKEWKEAERRLLE